LYDLISTYNNITSSQTIFSSNINNKNKLFSNQYLHNRSHNNNSNNSSNENSKEIIAPIDMKRNKKGINKDFKIIRTQKMHYGNEK